MSPSRSSTIEPWLSFVLIHKQNQSTMDDSAPVQSDSTRRLVLDPTKYMDDYAPVQPDALTPKLGVATSIST